MLLNTDLCTSHNFEAQKVDQSQAKFHNVLYCTLGEVPSYPSTARNLTLEFRTFTTDGSRELLLPARHPAFFMASPEIHHLFHHPIADHSFFADRQTLAVAHDNNVELYSRSGSKFTLQDELKGHDKTVTSVDIAPSSGRIVTCSQGMAQLQAESRNSLHTKLRGSCIGV